MISQGMGGVGDSERVGAKWKFGREYVGWLDAHT